jgi:hypothetical protein
MPLLGTGKWEKELQGEEILTSPEMPYILQISELRMFKNGHNAAERAVTLEL